MVYYLGDSIARESTVSDAAWTRPAQPPHRGRGQGARVRLLRRRPQPDLRDGREDRPGRCRPTQGGQPKGILLIGVGISRFIGPPTAQQPFRWIRRRRASCRRSAPGTGTTTTAARRSRRRASTSSCSAGWTAAGPGSSSTSARTLAAHRPDHRDGEGQGAAPDHRRPAARRAPSSAAASTSRARPSAPAAPTLARRYGIKYLRFTGSVGIPSTSFWDLHHLLRPGYEVWQCAALRRTGEGPAPPVARLAAGSAASSRGLRPLQRGTCCP